MITIMIRMAGVARMKLIMFVSVVEIGNTSAGKRTRVTRWADPVIVPMDSITEALKAFQTTMPIVIKRPNRSIGDLRRMLKTKLKTSL